MLRSLFFYSFSFSFPSLIIYQNTKVRPINLDKEYSTKNIWDLAIQDSTKSPRIILKMYQKFSDNQELLYII